MFGSWIVVAKTVKNFYKLGYTISIKISVKSGNGFFTFGNNFRSVKPAYF